jgi:hydroxymethylpyrimidine pyrophosphatase-like HAD family hydrolase
MRYLALACDFDGTLVANGKIQEQALAALARFRSTGRKLVLVTGRRLDDLSRALENRAQRSIACPGVIRSSTRPFAC